MRDAHDADRRACGPLVDLDDAIALEERRKTSLNTLARDFETRIGSLVSAFTTASTDLAATARSMNAALEQTGRQSNIGAAAAEELSVSIRDINPAGCGWRPTGERGGRSSVMIAAAVDEQGSAAGEIARNVQQTAGSARTVTCNIVEIGQAAQNNAVAATHVVSSASELSRQAVTLRQEVGQFLRLVESAGFCVRLSQGASRYGARIIFGRTAWRSVCSNRPASSPVASA